MAERPTLTFKKVEKQTASPEEYRQMFMKKIEDHGEFRLPHVVNMRENLKMLRRTTMRKSESTESILERDSKPSKKRLPPLAKTRQKSEQVTQYPLVRYRENSRSVELKMGSLYPGTDFSILKHNAFPLAPLSRAAQGYISNTLRDFEKARVDKLPSTDALTQPLDI